MASKRRIIAFVVAAAMALAMTFSVFFIAHNAEHKCSGTDCQICAQISNCIKNLNKITPKPESLCAVAAIAFAIVFCLGAICLAQQQKSLITLKVKLSD